MVFCAVRAGSRRRIPRRHGQGSRASSTWRRCRRWRRAGERRREGHAFLAVVSGLPVRAPWWARGGQLLGAVAVEAVLAGAVAIVRQLAAVEPVTPASARRGRGRRGGGLLGGGGPRRGGARRARLPRRGGQLLGAVAVRLAMGVRGGARRGGPRRLPPPARGGGPRARGRGRRAGRRGEPRRRWGSRSRWRSPSPWASTPASSRRWGSPSRRWRRWASCSPSSAGRRQLAAVAVEVGLVLAAVALAGVEAVLAVEVGLASGVEAVASSSAPPWPSIATPGAIGAGR